MKAEPVNQRIRFKGPGRHWQPPRDSAPVRIAPDQLDSRKDIEAEIAAAAAVDALAPGADEASWRSSSYDLMSGLQITDFEDTVPGELLDGLGL